MKFGTTPGGGCNAGTNGSMAGSILVTSIVGCLVSVAWFREWLRRKKENECQLLGIPYVGRKSKVLTRHGSKGRMGLHLMIRSAISRQIASSCRWLFNSAVTGVLMPS